MKKWKRILSRDANILLKCLVIRGVSKGPTYVLPEWPGMHDHFWSWKDGETGVHYLFSDLERFSDVVVSRTLSDTEFVKRYRSQSKQICDTSVKETEQIASHVHAGATNQELGQLFEKFCDSFSRLGQTIVMTLEEVQEQVLPALKSPNDLATLIASPELSIEAEEELNRLKLLAYIDEKYRNEFLGRGVETLREMPGIEQRIKTHVEHYGWIPLNFEKELWDVSFFVSLLQNFLRDAYDYATRITVLENHAEHIKREKEVLLQNIFDNSIRARIELLEATSFIRLYRATIFSLAFYRAFPLLTEIGRRIYLPLAHLKLYTPSEITRALAGNEELTSERALARKQAFVILTENDIYHQYEGKEAREVIQREYPEEETQRTERVHGMCAFPGNVRGPVRIISDAREMHKVLPGDILICEATNPDLVIAMARVGAIVTNEGGITSHAAIVSREMRKPCIIGTKIATKVFRNGDMVEVDAERGVVKKIS